MDFNALYYKILDRKKRMPKKSYVVSLLQNKDSLLQKIGEEATELVIVGKNKSKKRIIEETADLLFNILVLLVLKEITIKQIEVELESRNR